LKQLPISVVDLAIITVILVLSLWAAAKSHNNEARTPDRALIVD
jgi:hypothetical protein